MCVERNWWVILKIQLPKKIKKKNCDFMPSEKEYEIEQKISGRGWMLCWNLNILCKKKLFFLSLSRECDVTGSLFLLS